MRPGDVITYVNPAEETQGMSGYQKAIHFYQNKLGLNYALTMTLCLLFEIFISWFLGIKGMKSIPGLANLDAAGGAGSVTATIAGLILSGALQFIIVAELAQVVWLKHTDKLKVRIESGSIWWWIILITLLVAVLFNLFILFLSVTDRRSLADAWKSATSDQMQFFACFLVILLAALSKLRLASIMRVTTSDQIKRDVREKLEAIATEMLLDAGEATRAQAQEVWKATNVDPSKLVPLQDSVIRLISEQFPDIVPPDLGGDTWAYDFGGNSLALLPAPVHHALKQNQYRALNRPASDLDLYWQMPPEVLAEEVGYRLGAMGKPTYIDASEPGKAVYVTSKANFNRVAKTVEAGAGEVIPTKTKKPVDYEAIWKREWAAMTKPEQMAFTNYLINEVYPKKRGEAFPVGQGFRVVEAFSFKELGYFHTFWEENIKQK